MWWKTNKWKILVPVVILVILAAAFWFGGSAPGSHGLDFLESPSPSAEATPNVSAESTPPELPSPSPESTKPPENTVPASAELPAEPSSAPETPVSTPKSPIPVPSSNPLPVDPQDAAISDTALSCTISISCATILDNMELCAPEKTELVTSDGWILQPMTVTFYEGESVFNVLQRTCKQQGIHMEYTNTPIYNSAYIEGIHNLYEFDVGELSGWMYKVNDWFPNYGCSRYQLKDGDVICWVYTCDQGADVGGAYSAGSYTPAA